MSDTGYVDWLVNRLRSSEPGEIFSRPVEVCRHLLLAGLSSTVRQRRVKQVRQALAPIRLTSDVLQTVSQEDKNRAIARAKEWLNHRATFFSLRQTFLGDSIDWHRDYSSSSVGPKKYSGFINYRDASRVGDVKYVWELNRLHHIVLLALAASCTGEEVYRAEISEQSASWYEQNPFMIGLNWRSPLEAGIRIISWALTWSLMGHLGPQTIFHNEFLKCVYQHQYFIRKFHSKYSSANNHLIGEMAGLFIASVFWPHHRKSDSWRAFARKKIFEECLRQVETDGVAKERATEYQLFILEFLLLAGALGTATGQDFPQEYWERIGCMASFLTAIADRSGNIPMFGDGDSAQVVWLPQSTSERLRSLQKICQRNHAEVENDLRCRLLLWGQGSKDLPVSSLPGVDRELSVFAKGGYYVLSSNRGEDDEIIVVFDASPLGLPPLYAHGHADALSFWLSYGGQEFLIDPGTFSYYTQDKWRVYFRGTAAHNTVRIDGLDQSVTSGRFLWRYVADCQTEHIESNDEFINVRAVHNGYARLSDPVIHKRDVRLYKKNRLLLITDLLECNGNHDVEVFFHFSELCSVEQVAGGCFMVQSGDKRLSLRSDSRLDVALYRGSEQPIAGWMSRTFATKVPTVTLGLSTKISGSAEFVNEMSFL